jgi:uncharacterized membrane protein YczE
VGTVLTAFFMGPVIQWFVDHVAKPILDGKKEVVQEVTQE